MYSLSFCLHAQAPWYSSSISHHAHPSGTAPTPHLPPAFTSSAQRTSRHLPVLLLAISLFWPGPFSSYSQGRTTALSPAFLSQAAFTC
uniref:Uncharacterized protein n=1 Tax=Gopherus agassizii TaxID=38772 RepID=A0A452IRT1_9SAUR